MESKEGIDALFLHATEGILVTNAEGKITRINPSAEKLFGYRSGELTGLKIESLIPSRFTHKHENNRTNYGHHPHARSMGLGMELFGLKKDGSEFPVEISLSPYSNDEGNFVIAFILDITLRKESELKLKSYSEDLEKQVKNRTLVLEEAIKELERTKKELDTSLAKEKELNEMKSRFVSMASHEFRTPLTTMMSSLSLVVKYNERNDPDNHAKHIRKIEKSIVNLTDILNDFLSVSKLEEGKVENVPEELNLKQFLLDISSEMQGMLSEKQVITQQYSGEEQVFQDPKLLRNILFNLISNAIKFSPEEGVIELNTQVSEHAISILIKDKGIGISEQDQQHLFERFFRGGNAANIQGTGLGLNIVARYAELMSGKVTIESIQNKGTIVTLFIPR
ncbi:PAS domain-containing sensor histidine kinase [Fluviicola sp.]|uniref:PAS domain-containing sensor histidine kinase n=1 Tax=Fluviicola sp. TaxID=1917219 RepID=UPI00262451B4|nr:PAS domain-containing sensor histidine kinase [Fluviicola sp.]